MSATPTPAPAPDAPRRAMRRTRRGDEKSEQIRSAATELFLTRGYEAVSVDEIQLN
jgi:AcrR family transcriptional regulator